MIISIMLCLDEERAALSVDRDRKAILVGLMLL